MQKTATATNVSTSGASGETICFEPTRFGVKCGEKVDLSKNLRGISAADVLWSVSEPTIASIDDKGVFCGLKPATVTVSAISVTNESAKATAVITIGVASTGGNDSGGNDSVEIASYTLTFDLQNGDGGGNMEPRQKSVFESTNIDYAALWKIYDELYPARPTKSGYEFKGWSLFPNTDAVRNFNSEPHVMTTDITLYAVWAKTSVAFQFTGTTKTMKVQSGYSAKSTSPYTIESNSPVTVTVTVNPTTTKITWNDSTKKLDIAKGLPTGTYKVTMKATNKEGEEAAPVTFTLTVDKPNVAYMRRELRRDRQYVLKS